MCYEIVELFMKYKEQLERGTPPHIMKPEGSLPRLQELAICPYLQPDQSSKCLPFHFLKKSIIMLSTRQ